MLACNADGVMDGELLGTDDGLLGGNDDNVVGSDDGIALGISVCRAEGVDDSDEVELICGVVLVERARLG